MKTSFKTVITGISVCLLSAACNTLELRLYQTRTRADCTDRRGRTSATTDSTGTDSPQTPAIIPDTLLLFTAVDFDKGYDWKRDTAYGNSSFDVILYKDFKQTVRLSSSAFPGLSPVANTHHIIEGDLYTEHFYNNTTSIYRNENRLFGFEGREIILGILPLSNKGVYVLSRKLSDGKETTTLRLNGETVSSFDKGKPFGSMEDPSYGETGALYSSGDEEVCFCFDSEGENAGTRYLVVYKDHVDTVKNSRGSTVTDIKKVGDKTLLCSKNYISYTLEEPRIYKTPSEDGYAIGAYFSIGGKGQFTGVVSYDSSRAKLTRLCTSEATIYHSARTDYAIAEDEETEGISIYGSRSEEALYSQTSAYFPSPSSATIRENYFAAAVSSKNEKQPHPKIVFGDGKTVEIGINGYIGNVSTMLYVNPAK